MATSFTCSHRTSSTPEEVFDRARDVDLHLETMAASRERAVGGVTTGLLGPGDEVTWSAPLGPLGRMVEPLLRWYLRRLVCRRGRSPSRPDDSGAEPLQPCTVWL